MIVWVIWVGSSVCLASTGGLNPAGARFGCPSIRFHGAVDAAPAAGEWQARHKVVLGIAVRTASGIPASQARHRP
jgi:hypothetical protein